MSDISFSPRVIHKYDTADFTMFYYNRLYFADAGVYLINETIVSGNTNTNFDLVVTTRPTKISGGDGLYLMGDTLPYLGPETPTITVSASTPTNYYYGNLGQGSGINGQTGYFN